MLICPKCKSHDCKSVAVLESTDMYKWRKYKCFNCYTYFRTIEIATTEKPTNDINLDWLLRKE